MDMANHRPHRVSCKCQAPTCTFILVSSSLTTFYRGTNNFGCRSSSLCVCIFLFIIKCICWSLTAIGEHSIIHLLQGSLTSWQPIKRVDFCLWKNPTIESYKNISQNILISWIFWQTLFFTWVRNNNKHLGWIFTLILDSPT